MGSPLFALDKVFTSRSHLLRPLQLLRLPPEKKEAEARSPNLFSYPKLITSLSYILQGKNISLKRGDMRLLLFLSAGLFFERFKGFVAVFFTLWAGIDQGFYLAQFIGAFGARRPDRIK